MVLHRIAPDPDGTGHPNHIQQREVVPQERLVCMHGAAAGTATTFTEHAAFLDGFADERGHRRGTGALLAQLAAAIAEARAASQ